jgi:ABC-type glycerol-3-phosphate transport system substrate-binding protein
VTPPTARARLWRTALPAAVACVALAVAGCSSSSHKASTAPTAGKGDPNAQLVVWTDATRQAAFQAFQKAHPTVKMKVVVVDPASLLSKIQLDNRVGSGWPDVIFDSTPSDVASLSSSLFNYAQPLDTLVPTSVQNNFATHNAACTINGKLYCLQNDLAQDVIWYNKPLMTKFGYQVPTTWAQYQALGTEVAKQHPGYVIGAAGDVNIYYDYLWGSGCPLANVVNSTQVKINTADPKCTRVASTLDPLLANGSVSRLSPFDPAMIKIAKAGKVLMMPGPSWFGQYVFQPTTSYATPNGQLAAAPIPTWAGETTNYSGAWGGGIYVVSSHSKNEAGAAAIAQWVATSSTYQATAPTYPAYIPAAQAWTAALKSNPFYAGDPSSVLADAAGKINPAEAATRYQVAPAVTSTLVAAIKAGQSIASALPALQTQLSGLAQTVGYAVSP